jgi:hypothetical protein
MDAVTFFAALILTGMVLLVRTIIRGFVAAPRVTEESRNLRKPARRR